MLQVMNGLDHHSNFAAVLSVVWLKQRPWHIFLDLTLAVFFKIPIKEKFDYLSISLYINTLTRLT